MSFPSSSKALTNLTAERLTNSSQEILEEMVTDRVSVPEVKK